MTTGRRLAEKLVGQIVTFRDLEKIYFNITVSSWKCRLNGIGDLRVIENGKTGKIIKSYRYTRIILHTTECVCDCARIAYCFSIDPKTRILEKCKHKMNECPHRKEDKEKRNGK